MVDRVTHARLDAAFVLPDFYGGDDTDAAVIQGGSPLETELSNSS